MQANIEREQWRNNRGVLGIMFFFAGLLLLGGAFLAIAAVGTLFPFQAANLGTAVSIAVAAGATFFGGLSLWRMALKAARHRAVFESDGVHFFYGAKETDVIAWPDIKEVTQGGGQITINAGEDRYLSFDGYSFFLPSRLGKALARRAGTELKAVTS
jgi:hypothetical protein